MIATVAAAVALSAVVFVVAGAPSALAVRERTGSWGSALADALIHGLVLTALAVTLFSWIAWTGVVLAVLAWAGFLVVAVTRRAGLPAIGRPDRGTVLLTAAWVALSALTLALRFRSVNFLPWVGDMGAYVNWANEFVRLGELKATWPPFFPSYLAMSSAVFGPSGTTAALPLSGLILVLVVGRLLRQLGVGPWLSFTSSALLAVNLHAIWFSTFPGSESINAPIFIAWISAVVGAMRATSRRTLGAWLGLAGILMLALGLLRGTGPLLLAPLLATAIVATVVGVWRGVAPRIWLALGTSLAGAFVSYWYGIVEIPRYYVTTQVADLVPGPLFRLAEGAGLFTPSALTALVLVLITAVIGIGGWAIARRRAAGRPSRVPGVLGLVLGGAILLGMLADAIVRADVFQILLRTGVWLIVVTIVLVLLLGRTRLPDWVMLVVLWLGTTTAIFLAIHTYRLKIARGHAFFLYWDRYIFSEIVPLLYVFLGLGLAVLCARLLRPRVAALHASPSRLRRAIPAAVAVLAIAAVVVPTLPSLRLVTKDTYMQGAFAFEQNLIGLLPDERTPVAWAGTSEGSAPGFFFPNTWMAFAKPLQRTYGYQVVNIGGRPSDFAPDIVYDIAGLTADVAATACDRLVVFETESGGARLDQRLGNTGTPGLVLTPLGSATSDISLLSQPPTNGDWTHAAITVNAWLVSTPAAPAGCVG